MTTANLNPEIGRALRVDELRRKTVVCIRREDTPYWLTLWVKAIDDDTVIFLAGATLPRVHFTCFRMPDGGLYDGTGKRIWFTNTSGRSKR